MSANAAAVDARSFRLNYAAHRAAEGRAHSGAELAMLPYLDSGPLARQWSVRARSFDALVARIVLPAAIARGGALSILDLGAGCGWLCYRTAAMGHSTVALDIRDDCVDGLGAAAWYLQRDARLFARVSASFDALPLAERQFDLVVFNASIHYALDLETVIREAARVTRAGGRLVIVDSPFYRDEKSGVAMVEEKRRRGAEHFGSLAESLLAPTFVEFLTPARLARAAGDLALVWRRHRVNYPLWYEMRAVTALLCGRRPPSRFDLWECTVS
jgi:SAM-dependent methyltransferase